MNSFSQLFYPSITSSNTETWNGSTYTVAVTQQPGPELSMRSRSWSRTPGYKALNKNRKKRTTINPTPPNPYYDTQRKLNGDGHGQVVWTPDSWYPANTRWLKGRFVFPKQYALDLSDARFTTLYNAAVQRLPSKMNGAGFNLPLFLAEAHKSVFMIRDAASSIQKIVKKQKTGRKVHDMWLEYRYGWRLLLKDIYDALVVVHEIRNAKVKQHVTATSTYESVGVETYSTLCGPQNYGVSIVNKCEYQDELRVKISLNYRDSSPAMGTLQQLGISNPFLVAWELVPYSFVLDWFVPVGEYLQGIDSYLGKEFLSGTVSKSYNRKFKVTASSPSHWDNFQYPRSVFRDLAADSVSGTARNYRREVLSSFPVANLPLVRANLNVSRCVDSISLLLQQKSKLTSAWRARSTFTE